MKNVRTIETFREKGLIKIRSMIVDHPELTIDESTFVTFKDRMLFYHCDYGEWWACPNLVLGSRKMKHPSHHRWDATDLRKEIHKGKFPRTFIDFKDEDFVNVSTPMEFNDEKYGLWSALPSSILSGNNHKQRFHDSTKRKPGEVEEQIKKERPFISIDHSTFSGMNKKCSFIDETYGKWVAKPSKVLLGSNHPKRYIDKLRLSAEEVQERINSGTEYSEPRNYLKLIKESYIDTTKKATFLDEKYGKFDAFVYTVLKGVDHQERVKVDSIIPVEEIERRLIDGFKDSHPRPYLTLDRFTYVNATTPARFIDNKYGEMWAKPVYIFEGHDHPARAYQYTGIERKISEALGIEKNYRRMSEIVNIVPDFIIKDVVIECDGLYFHSERRKDDNYHHFNRRKMLESLGFKVLQFREDEINFKFPVVMSIINNALGNSSRVYARKLQVKEVGAKEARKFFDENHLMGGTNHKALGLFLGDSMQACMSYHRKKEEVHIGRFCNLLSNTVVGAYSRLLKAISKDVRCERMINFVDLRYGNGEHLLEKGFVRAGVSLGWKWTNGVNTFNRLRCRANMDARRLTEREHAAELGWYKIYDAGQAKFIREERK